MLTKKSKYRPVNTNPKKEKKQSSLSSYKFVSLGKPCDFAAFKKEITQVLTTVVVSGIPPRVYEYYHQLCKGTLDTAIKLLKQQNGTNKREVPVTFTTDITKDELILSDLEMSYTFDKEALTITRHFKDGKDIVNEDAAKFLRLIQYTEHTAAKKKETKDFGTQVLTTEWLPIRDKLNLLNHAPEYYHDWNGDKIVERAKITDLHIRIIDKQKEANKEPDFCSLFTLKVNDDKHNQFVYGITKNVSERTAAFMIETTAKGLLQSLDKQPCSGEDVLDFWGKYFTEDVKLTIFCTGKLDIQTGELTVVSSVVYRAVSDEFRENVEIEVTGFKTDAAVYVDKANDLPKETLDTILKEAEVDPLGVMESKN